MKSEVNKDILLITISDVNGDLLSYKDFLDYFKIYIYDKSYFIDDVRMI